ncbi:MAG: TetR/AcrR family transcriptional regulator [Betaproteobacteria bacterium]
MAGKRMTKAVRRLQLLDTAAAMIRAGGTDALTLANLAERAGVSKPIAYEHFETRNGLLMQLYQHLDDRHMQRVAMALSAAPMSLDATLTLFSEAFIDCGVETGPEFGAIAAALAASPELASFRLGVRARYLEAIRLALTAHPSVGAALPEAVLIGLIGAANELAQEAASGRLARDAAVAALNFLARQALPPRLKPSVSRRAGQAQTPDIPNVC